MPIEREEETGTVKMNNMTKMRRSMNILLEQVNTTHTTITDTLEDSETISMDSIVNENSRTIVTRSGRGDLLLQLETDEVLPDSDVEWV